MNPAHPDFQRAYVAVAYLAGVRGEALLEAFEQPSRQARELLTDLGAEDRAQRARALASELQILARRLAKLGLAT